MKPLAEYTAEEALREIESLINIDLHPGRRIDQLAGHLALMVINAQTAQREYIAQTERDMTRLAIVRGELLRVLRDTTARKTVRRDEVDFVYRLATQ